MAPIEIASGDMPLAERLMEGLRYPFRGAALTACLILAGCHCLVALPGIFGAIAAMLIWIVTWLYAVDCLMHTADGYADPPDLGMEGRAANARGILGMQILATALCYLVALVAPAHLWLALLVAVLVLPAIDLSLAFDGDVLIALNPVNWLRIVARFGAAYFIPVVANAVLAVLVVLAGLGLAHLPALLGLPLFGFLYTCVIVLEFHWMGLLVWHYRERLGVHPQAPELAQRVGQGADDELVGECEALAKSDPEEAAIRLRDRIRERAAPAPVHALFRTLLRRLQRNDLLLSHGQDWIAQLCAAGDARRALGLVQECRGIDAAFLPDDPGSAATLAELATRLGMRDLAQHLAHGFAQRWPRHERAARLEALASEGARPT